MLSPLAPENEDCGAQSPRLQVAETRDGGTEKVEARVSASPEGVVSQVQVETWRWALANRREDAARRNRILALGWKPYSYTATARSSARRAHHHIHLRDALGPLCADLDVVHVKTRAHTCTTSRSAFSAPGRQWTNDGAVHEERGLKGRGRRASRTVPIPPVLVGMLREHLRQFGIGMDGRLFRSEQGNPIQPSTYWRVWQRTRELALTPEEREGPLLKRPYDLRHAGVTYRLNKGVPAPQVAKW
ncbi:hypothetical protein EMG21_29160, partial [Klebsiella pneumoniae]